MAVAEHPIPYPVHDSLIRHILFLFIPPVLLVCSELDSYLPSPMVILRTKFTITAANSAIAKIVGPSRSSKPPCPRIRMLLARQWNVKSAYTIAIIATMVNKPALILPILSPKLRRPIASPPRMTVKLSHERKVRSFAKNTLGSTRVGRAMRLPGRMC
jgi:hypothetical protein